MAALAAAGIDIGPGDGECLGGMPWAGGRGSVTLGAYVMLPDDPVECPADVGA